MAWSQRITRSNPYVGEKGRDEIYARPPQPVPLLDRNRILIGDVGEDRREEVDAKPLRKARGANFGWPIYEGTLRFRHGHIRHPAKPIFQYPHKGGNCAITGGVVIRDKRLRGLRSRYIYGDYCSGQIRTFRLRKGRARQDRALRVRRANGPVAFGVEVGQVADGVGLQALAAGLGSRRRGSRRALHQYLRCASIAFPTLPQRSLPVGWTGER